MAECGSLVRELECGVCLEVLRQPKILDCSHTFCGPCLQKLVQSKTQIICCPLCQQVTNLPPGGVSGLKSNILARSMVDAIMNQDSVEVGLEAHEVPSVTPSQFPLSSTSLDQCPPNHTLAGSTKNPRHEITDLAQLLKTRQLLYQQTEQIIKMRQVDLNAAATQAKEGVATGAQVMIADIHTKEQELFSQIDFICSTRKSTMETHLASINSVLQDVNIASEDLENLDGKDNAEIEMLCRRVKYGLERMEQSPLPTADMTDGLSFLKFNTEKMPSFNLHLGDLLEYEKWNLDFKFGTYGSKIGEFNCALGIGISPSGDMAITEQLNHRTCIFSMDGRHKRNMTGKSSDQPDREDRDVAFLPDGRCLILNQTSQIKVYDTNGGYMNSILTPVKSPWCFDVDQGGTVYLADSQNNLIYVMVDGVIVRKIPIEIKAIGLAVDNKGHILVSSMVSRRVDVLNIADGDILCTIASSSIDPCIMVSPWGVCFAPDGSIYVSFYNSKVLNEGTVHEFSLDGRHLGCVARGFQAPRRLGCTRDGRLIVVDGTSIKIYRKV